MDLQIIPSKEIQQGKKLGEGGFGIVFAGTWNGHQVAIKTLRLNDLSKELEEEFTREAKVMASLNHPAIIHLYGICKEKDSYAMVIDYLPKGDLYKLLQDKKRALPWNPLRWQLAIDIAGGLAYLHKRNILHRDLKSLNVLLTDKFRAKITDFGLSKIKFQTKTTSTQRIAGSIPWMAPELFKRGVKITKAVDIYAFGMVLWEIAARKVPFSDAHNPDVIPTWVKDGEREDIPKDCPEKIGELIKQCWSGESEKRLDAATVLETLAKVRPEPTKALSTATHIQTPLKNEITVVIQQEEVPGPKEYKKAWSLMQQRKYREAMPLLLKAAENKYLAAYLHLWRLYTSKESMPEGEDKSGLYYVQIDENLSWFEEQAKSKNPHSLINLGYWHHLKVGTAAKPSIAFKCFLEAAQGGDPQAMYLVGHYYDKGIGTSKSESLAKKYYGEAAQQNHAEAAFILAKKFYINEQSEESRQEGFRLFALAAQLDHLEALFYVAVCFWKGIGTSENIKQAIDFFEKSAKLGNQVSQYYLGTFYQKGEGVEQNNKKAREYFQCSAAQGFQDAIIALNMNQDYQRGVELIQKCEYRKALSLMHNAAKAKYPPAYLMLGWLYAESGRVGPYNRATSNRWYKRAAQSGNPVAQVEVGKYYIKNGYDTGSSFHPVSGKDPEESLKYFRVAANRGDAEGQFWVGECYKNGWGVSKSNTQAKKYFQLAANQGHERAKSRLEGCSIM